MAIEPLADSTRTAKRNLLIAGVLAVTYRAFEVTIDKLPVAGIVIDFNKGLFAFLLTIVLVYFLITFCLYYFIDIRNIDLPPHQVKAHEQYWAGVGDRVERFIHIARNRANRLLDAGDVHILYTAQMAKLLHELARSPRDEQEKLILECEPRALYELHLRNQMNSVVQYPARATEFEKVDDLVVTLLHKFRKFERPIAFAAKSRVVGVNIFYGFRNYFLDGALPVGLGVAGLLAMYEILPLQWVRYIAPAQ